MRTTILLYAITLAPLLYVGCGSCGGDARPMGLIAAEALEPPPVNKRRAAIESAERAQQKTLVAAGRMPGASDKQRAIADALEANTPKE